MNTSKLPTSTVRLSVSAVWLLRVAQQLHQLKGGSSSFAINIDARQQLLKITEMDNAHVCLLETQLRPPLANVTELSATTKGGTVSLAFTTGDLVEALESEFFRISGGRGKRPSLAGREGEMVQITVSEDAGFDTAVFTAEDVEFSLPLCVPDVDTLGIPEVDHASAVSVSPTLLARAIKGLASMGMTSIVLKTPKTNGTDGGVGLREVQLLGTEEDVGAKVTVPLYHDREEAGLAEQMDRLSIVDAKPEAVVVQHYATRYLQIFADMGVKCSLGRLQIFHSMDTPIEFNYSLTSGEGNSCVRLFLAPKIVDDY